ncbi:MAG: hypothetical protein GY821_01490 [Gammaproteobacteria bacterium]|nr:hypothetical protein [Gammaproteobacteria bacterium]
METWVPNPEEEEALPIQCVEVPRSKFVQKYSAKLMNVTEYWKKILGGPQGDQMIEQFTEELQHRFKITEGGEQGQLLKEYCRELEAVNVTLHPTTTPLTPVR